MGPVNVFSFIQLSNFRDLISFEKNLDSGRKMLFIFNIKCYTVHSADPLYVFGVL